MIEAWIDSLYRWYDS